MKDLHQIPEDSPYFAEFVEGRRGEILDAAMRVFVEKGYDGGSMRDIATRVGVTEPAIYRHFGSKEDLFVALMKVGAIHAQASVRRGLEGLAADDLRGQLLAMIAEKRQSMRLWGPGLRNLLPAAARNPRFRDEYRNLMVIPTYEQLRAKAAELDEAIGVPDAEATRDGRVRALMALAIGFAVSSFVLQDEPDEAVVDAALRTMGWDITE